MDPASDHCQTAMRYSLRTLLIGLAILPIYVAGILGALNTQLRSVIETRGLLLTAIITSLIVVIVFSDWCAQPRHRRRVR